MADPTTPAPAAPDLGAEAKEFMQENFAVYRDKGHPQHGRVVREVNERFDAVYPAPPQTNLTPEEQAAADAPISPPPSLGPNDRLAQVPESPDGYELAIPQAPQDSPGWDPDAWSRFKATSHQVGLSHHQAQAVTNRFVTRGIEMLRLAGPDGVSPEHLAEMVSFAKGIGLTEQQTSTMLDLFESQASPRTGKPPAQVAAEKLMADRTLGYFDRAHPKHQATVARVNSLFAEADQGPGYYRR